MSRPRVHPALVAGGAVMAAALAAILVVSFVMMRRVSDAETCKINLRLLDMAVKGGALPRDPAWDRASAGRAFFADLHRWPKPPDRPVDLRCPVRGARDGRDDYRGPAGSIRTHALGDPYIADREGNHGPNAGGNVVLLNGDVLEVPASHPLWARAAVTTSE